MPHLTQKEGIVPSRSFGAKVDGFKLHFIAENGMATIAEEKGSVVFGACHLITVAEKKRLDMLEGDYSKRRSYVCYVCT